MTAPIVTQEVLTGKFTAWSRDPEYPHCYGTGDTEANALISYKLLKRNEARRTESRRA